MELYNKKYFRIKCVAYLGSRGDEYFIASNDCTNDELEMVTKEAVV